MRRGPPIAIGGAGFLLLKAKVYGRSFGAGDSVWWVWGEWEKKRLGAVCSHFQSGHNIVSRDISEYGDYEVDGGNGLREFTDDHTHKGFYLLIGRQGALCGNINRAKGKTYISEHAIAVQGNSTNDTEFLAQYLYQQKLRNTDLITVLIEAPLAWWYSSDLKTSIPYLVGTVVFKW
ncbi:restriction endonuclease subunit S [Neolewinella antarctica]|uniref:Type I restriction modification DNA specificity domain-containing protein n=1 Tax=Neolewinella antarctica TaxID=442734 RepID=A0ABX0XFE7_9BACT|nr:restriction endonuclease subunit S [Neolewinella antarctica]NJC28045.1 hypothetical protein [Neolewinella antarctica]